jgi:hypothetical protein
MEKMTGKMTPNAESLIELRVDRLAAKYLELQDRADEFWRDAAIVRAELIELVAEHGSHPPRADKTMRLTGRLYELRVTSHMEVTVDTRLALLLRRRAPRLFRRLFCKVERFVLNPGAEKLLNARKLPPGAPHNLRSLFARALHLRDLPQQLEVRRREKEPEAA